MRQRREDCFPTMELSRNVWREQSVVEVDVRRSRLSHLRVGVQRSRRPRILIRQLERSEGRNSEHRVRQVALY